MKDEVSKCISSTEIHDTKTAGHGHAQQKDIVVHNLELLIRELSRYRHDIVSFSSSSFHSILTPLPLTLKKLPRDCTI